MFSAHVRLTLKNLPGIMEELTVAYIIQIDR